MDNVLKCISRNEGCTVYDLLIEIQKSSPDIIMIVNETKFMKCNKNILSNGYNIEKKGDFYIYYNGLKRYTVMAKYIKDKKIADISTFKITFNGETHYIQRFEHMLECTKYSL